MSRKIPRTFLSLISGALLPLAYAPFNILPLAFLCPAILLLLWSAASPRAAFRYGYSFGLGLFGVGVYWLHISINMFGGVTFIGAVAITAALVVFLAVYPALAGYIGRRWLAQNETFFLLVAAPALWVLAEWLRSWVFTGFPWLNLGYTQTDSFFSALAPVFGVYAISWLTMLLAALLAALYRSQGRQAFACIMAIILLAGSCWWLNRVQWTKPEAREISVALVQAAIPQRLKWLPEMREQSLSLYMQLSAPHWGRDLLIWPETAIPAYSHSIPRFIDQLRTLTATKHTTFLSGIPSKDKDSGEYHNSVMMLSAGRMAWYHKQHLVPFGEYLPLKPLLSVIVEFLRIPISDFSPGRQARPLLDSEIGSLGVSICYEDTFGEELIAAMPEARLLVNVSNDAWFGDSLAPHQHLQMARMRALETGRYLLRATNTGISAIIDEKGRLLKRSAQFEATALTASVRLFSGTTPYAMWGNYPVVLTALFILLVSAYYRRRNS